MLGKRYNIRIFCCLSANSSIVVMIFEAYFIYLSSKFSDSEYNGFLPLKKTLLRTFQYSCTKHRKNVYCGTYNGAKILIVTLSTKMQQVMVVTSRTNRGIEFEENKLLITFEFRLKVERNYALVPF